MNLFDFLNEIDTSNLAADSKWNIIRGGIEIAVTAGLSMAETARQLRAGNLAFTDAPFRELFREISGYRASFSYTANLNPAYSPNPDLMANAAFPIEGDFGYVGRFTFYDETTGKLSNHTFRIDSDSLLSGNDALSELESYLANKSANLLDGIIGGVEYIGAIKNI